MPDAAKRVDNQIIELAGRNWLASELQRAGIEIARPERDRGVDLIAYVDLDECVGNFVACPIQMKASTRTVFSLYPRYAKFPNLILAYVWHVGSPSKTIAPALTYQEALKVATRMGWTKTNSWLKGSEKGRSGYSSSNPSARLREALAEYQMDSNKWWLKITRQANVNSAR